MARYSYRKRHRPIFNIFFVKLMRLAVLIASFNRVAVTLRGLNYLLAGLDTVSELDTHIFLVDDASPDGTGEIVKKQYPAVNVVFGNGRLFWNGGMCLAYESSLPHGSFDAFLLFNDDVIIITKSMAKYFADFVELNIISPTILTGAMTSVCDGSITYSGYRETSKFQPLSFESVLPNGTLQNVDTFNGNFVLIPGSFFTKINGLDPNYRHGYGDIDLGFVARRHGVRSILWGDVVGYCERNTPLEELLRGKKFSERLRLLFEEKNTIRQHLYFVWKNRPREFFVIYLIHVIWVRLMKAIRIR